ncbi:glycoside hydrolase family 16 protein [Luteimonas kalidii]|uniref:Family 16 glycosylhydrolase n=1 Tax=Luteimonas kalidii TaxID=3042025 RepID=A0ABT6JRL8_9GAMM|nr:glycoside hydrolase family 16 protein [Luteimonas kalidii]MDH5833329.1 family 16 glycosylhydrolase [Luteimonas kalidii]
MPCRPSAMLRTALLLACLSSTACAAPLPAREAGGPRASAPAATAFDTLAWSDEFDTANADDWTFETGGHGWGNQELQYYTDGSNAFIQYDALAGSRVLVIEARRGAPAGASCWYGACQYSSTRMISRGKREFRHGRIEARIRLPQTQGIWPAFWMLGANLDQVGWPQSGEIDIMEHVGFEPTLTHGALHGPGYSGNTPFSGTHDLGERADARYHVYAVEWDAAGIRWFVDGQPFYSLTRAQVEARGPWVFDQPFFLLLNVAVGGSWPGSPDTSSMFPQRMYVDWVRVYQPAPPRIRRNGAQPLAPPGAARPPSSAPAPRRTSLAASAAAPAAQAPTRPALAPLLRLGVPAAAGTRAIACDRNDGRDDTPACADATGDARVAPPPTRTPR